MKTIAGTFQVSHVETVAAFKVSDGFVAKFITGESLIATVDISPRSGQLSTSVGALELLCALLLLRLSNT